LKLKEEALDRTLNNSLWMRLKTIRDDDDDGYDGGGGGGDGLLH
jgi:hypothetical protein